MEKGISAAVDYLNANKDAYLQSFMEVLRIPSISTDPAYAPEIQRAADWIVAEMERIGMENCKAIADEGHPVVYGDWLHAGDDKPTILIYAHYDVQPIDPIELWESPPFEPTIRDGRIYCRGVIDDKAGVIGNLKAIESIMATVGKLPLNVKVFFEGEEESGSVNMKPFIQKYKDMLEADILILSDGPMEEEQPMIFTSVRGIVDGEVVITGPGRDLHSGSFGGAVHNPIHYAAKIIADMHDDEGRILIPGFYDDVKPVSENEMRAMNSQKEFFKNRLKNDGKLKAFWGVKEYSVLERVTSQPTCDINGVFGGYQGEGGKTVIPSQAGFKFSMRLVADQDPDDILTKTRAFFESYRTDTVEIDIRMYKGGNAPAQLVAEGPAMDALQKAYMGSWGKEALLYRQGGSVPIMAVFKEELGIPILVMSHGVGTNGHSPNEYFVEKYFYKGIETAIHAMYNWAASGV